ncbi:MAG: sulfatase [Candidatus Hydrogenedentota bacterium]
MKRREFLKLSNTAIGAAAIISTTGANAVQGEQRMNRPNIIMITCHDIGQYLGCYGVKTVQTPNLDNLASKGIRFENFYSTSAVCSPGRGSLHTGRYPQSNGLMGLTHAPWWWSLNEAEKHTAVHLKELGYVPHLIGFNHIDSNTKRLGYDAVASQNRKATETVAAAKDLINDTHQSDKPFFAKIGFTEVHRPFTHGSDTSKGLFIPPWLQDTPEMRDDLAAFQAEIAYFDARVGEILDALYASPIVENTLVIMTSDHGIPYPGAKWSVRKAGIEVPFIVYQPGTVFTGGKVFTEVMSNVDVLPTLLEYLGVQVPSNIQGVSFLEFIQGTSKTPPRIEAFSQYTPDMKRDNLSRSVITARYHLIRYFDQGRAVAYPADVNPQRFAGHLERCKTKGTRPFAQLFDLQTDPYELNDIADAPENAGIVKELSDRLLDWIRQVNDPLLEGLPRTPYYARAMADFLGKE